MRRLRKGDEVVVTAGKDKGKRGTVLQVLADERVLVEGINLVKKHTRGNPQRGTAGGIIEKELPLDGSNLMVWNPTAAKGDRIGFRFLEDGRKVRYFKSNGEVVDV